MRARPSPIGCRPRPPGKMLSASASRRNRIIFVFRVVTPNCFCNRVRTTMRSASGVLCHPMPHLLKIARNPHFLPFSSTLHSCSMKLANLAGRGYRPTPHPQNILARKVICPGLSQSGHIRDLESIIDRVSLFFAIVPPRRSTPCSPVLFRVRLSS